MMCVRRQTSNDSAFTLLELLIAIAILAFIAVLISTAIKGTGRALDVANRQAQDGSVGAVQMVLRQMLAQAQPIKLASERVEDARFLDGTPSGLHFVSSFATGGQYGGLYDTEISTVPSPTGAGFDLTIQQTVFRRPLPGATSVVAKGRSIVILKSIAAVNWRYYGRVDEASPPDWVMNWSNRSRLPTLIALSVQFPPGDPRVWADLIVAPRRAD